MRKGTHPRTALGQTAAQMIRRYYLHDVARETTPIVRIITRFFSNANTK